MNKSLTLDQIRFCALECSLQESGENSVANMCIAFDHVESLCPSAKDLTLLDILTLGKLVEPYKNVHGFRKVPVFFGKDPTRQAIPADHINAALQSLLDHGTKLTNTEWYTEFEKIHPFNDGNGRVGTILFNFRANTLLYPILPPKVFG